MTTTKLIKHNIVDEIKAGIDCSSSTAILVSFMMVSGLELILPSLQRSLDKGTQIKILTGDYLYITQPDALSRLDELVGDIELRLWKSHGVSFHPKAYLFESDHEKQVIVGSSNLSKSALTTGVEWNVSIEQQGQADVFEEAEESFLQLFYADQTVPINRETIEQYRQRYETYHAKYPGFVDRWHSREAEALMFDETEPTIVRESSNNQEPIIIEPRPHQALALDALDNVIKEDYDKALIVMATGLGKTYLAAFFARQFNRVLFIAHREEILRQAKQSFDHVLPNKSSSLYNQEEKNNESDHIFASVFTLSRKNHLNRFNSSDFDLIVVDEFHHAAAKSYQGILQYFKREFLLGITATPDRLDGKDVYALCDNNVAFQMHFIEAIQHGYLTPFKYFGVYDETDYSSMTWLGNRYDQHELEAKQLQDAIAEKIFNAWEKHKQKRTISFCSSIRQAKYLEDYFVKKGVNAISLHSKTMGYSRQEAIKALKDQTIDIIFTVDLFNEGVDIPEVDTLLFVRPTESLTIYTQQVGRGLRLSTGKTHCHIIDLIGNYKNADVKMQLFDTERDRDSRSVKHVIPEVPTSCELHLDMQVVDLIKYLVRKRQPRKERLISSYHMLKTELGRRPTYLEIHRYGKEDAKQIKQEFKSYMGLLHHSGELTLEESDLYNRFKSLIEDVERTLMSKSYKMVVLKLMLDRGENQWHRPITASSIAYPFCKFLTDKDYRRKKDFSDKKTKKLLTFDEDKIVRLIEDMPFSKWNGSSKGIFTFDREQFAITVPLTEQEARNLYPFINDIVEYRLTSYFERGISKKTH
ncbi:DNA helicase [Halolactibacillus miurensis]|uniref:DNA helicase n=1 Tax=Halolactibacillus miurensis TaxID=306541 RepID=A0A1I6R1F1_9BACI|nr:DEAD/DEAH box helicase family protein [Halolactibacillus miurensis]GEM03661.1 DNA helicase [Halolactibacillus miurensis]SFS58567.1 Superfamily II DNA or RNA helicase [Halolactibacillus miurensis]